MSLVLKFVVGRVAGAEPAVCVQVALWVVIQLRSGARFTEGDREGSG